MNRMLYHISPVHGLKLLTPHVSTHGKACVYAVENCTTGLLFGARQDDFDFDISTDARGIPTITECYPGALIRKYRACRCSIYEINRDGFISGVTGWLPEWVCPRTVPVVRETIVPDLLARLREEENRGSLRIRCYRSDAEFREEIRAHVTERLRRFHIDLAHIMERDARFADYHRDIIESFSAVTD